MKNFQVKHSQCDSIIFVRGPDKKTKEGVGLFQILQKKKLFHLSCQTSALGDNLTMWSPFSLPPSKKGLSFPFSLGKEIMYLETQLNGELTDLF